MPPALLEEVFALNEELDEIRELRESGGDAAAGCARGSRRRASRSSASATSTSGEMQELSARWDTPGRRVCGGARATLDALRERLLERNYINNLLATIEREAARTPGCRLGPARRRRSRGPKPGAEAMSKVVGIDLGTTNSLVAYVKDGVPVVIRDESGDALVPSVVSVGEDGTIFVGREAQRRLLTAPSRTVYSVKRFMGRGIEDVARATRALLPFGVGGEPGGVVRIGVGGREFTPPEISAFVLRELKRRAEDHFREQGEFDFEVDRAVITVPAYFNDAQRTATRDAGRLAGLEVLRIINEPTAASLAYGLDKRNRGTIAVYDLGGGTFDISILKVEDGVFQVLATNGDTHLGGDDIDRAADGRWCSRRSPGAEAPATGSPRAGLDRREAIQAIRKAVIQAKWDLSERDEAEIRVEPMPGLPGWVPTRHHARRVRAADPAARRADAGALPAGAGRRRASSRRTSTRPCSSAARRAFRSSAASVEELFGRQPHSELNPDEVVALGAAVQADILISGRREMLLLDVTPLSLGIETMGGVMSKIILRNSTIPASGREMFTTAVDNQTAVDIHVLQGERELAADCRSLARFQPARHPADAGRAAAHRGAVPDRRQRHPERQRARAAHGRSSRRSR